MQSLEVHQRSGLKTLHRSLFTFENSPENFLGTACSTPAPRTHIIEKRDTSYEMSLISMVRVTGVEPAAWFVLEIAALPRLMEWVAFVNANKRSP